MSCLNANVSNLFYRQGRAFHTLHCQRHQANVDALNTLFKCWCFQALFWARNRKTTQAVKSTPHVGQGLCFISGLESLGLIPRSTRSAPLTHSAHSSATPGDLQRHSDHSADHWMVILDTAQRRFLHLSYRRCPNLTHSTLLSCLCKLPHLRHRI